MILPRAWFDAEKCALGIKALRHYRREWNEAAQTWRSAPVHDHASHGADAARYLALGVRENTATGLDAIIERQFPSTRLLQEHGANTGWMSV
jgi:hypothetical protein